jgi:hypothetical protein
VIGGRSAALLHSLWLPASDVDRVEAIICRGGARPHELAASRRREVWARRRSLRPDERTIVAGLPVTSEARTWVDIAETLSVEDLVAAGDSVLRGATGLSELEAAVRAAVGRRGVLRAREALPLLDARSRSRPESHLRCALVRRGLPVPEVNAAIYTPHGEWLAEPDLHYRQARLALEYNGAEHAQPGRMRRDITRELDVERNGWLSLVFGPAEVFGRPDELASLVRAVLDVRDPGWFQTPPKH